MLQNQWISSTYKLVKTKSSYHKNLNIWEGFLIEAEKCETAIRKNRVVSFFNNFILKGYNSLKVHVLFLHENLQNAYIFQDICQIILLNLIYFLYLHILCKYSIDKYIYYEELASKVQ